MRALRKARVDTQPFVRETSVHRTPCVSLFVCFVRRGGSFGHTTAAQQTITNLVTKTTPTEQRTAPQIRRRVGIAGFSAYGLTHGNQASARPAWAPARRLQEESASKPAHIIGRMQFPWLEDQVLVSCQESLSASRGLMQFFSGAPFSKVKNAEFHPGRNPLCFQPLTSRSETSRRNCF